MSVQSVIWANTDVSLTMKTTVIQSVICADSDIRAIVKATA